MDLGAITELRARWLEAVGEAEKYRALASATPGLRAFYHALAVTHERAAREMQIMLDTVDRIAAIDEAAA
jgi:hypothetical protein